MKKQEDMEVTISCQGSSRVDPNKTREMNMWIFVKKLEIAEPEEDNASAKWISEKKMEVARAENSKASTSLRSVSSIPIRIDPFEKVSSWLDRIAGDRKPTENGKIQNALASETVQRKLDALPRTSQIFQLAAMKVQPIEASLSNECDLFVPKSAPATLKKAAPKHVRSGKVLPPNHLSTINKMKTDTVPPHVAPPVILTASTKSHFGPTHKNRKRESISQFAKIEVSRVLR